MDPGITGGERSEISGHGEVIDQLPPDHALANMMLDKEYGNHV
jgi:hypothetical protein